MHLLLEKEPFTEIKELTSYFKLYRNHDYDDLMFDAIINMYMVYKGHREAYFAESLCPNNTDHQIYIEKLKILAKTLGLVINQGDDFVVTRTQIPDSMYNDKVDLSCYNLGRILGFYPAGPENKWYNTSTERICGRVWVCYTESDNVEERVCEEPCKQEHEHWINLYAEVWEITGNFYQEDFNRHITKIANKYSKLSSDNWSLKVYHEIELIPPSWHM